MTIAIYVGVTRGLNITLDFASLVFMGSAEYDETGRCARLFVPVGMP